MSVTSVLQRTIAKGAPRLEEVATRARWRLGNRSRAVSAGELHDENLRPALDLLQRDGLVISTWQELFGDRELLDAASARARELYDAPRTRTQAEEGSKETFKTKLAAGSFDAADPFVQIALHPSALALANGYLRLRSTLRALELWLTEPTEGPAIQTQLWHRDADDVMNVKLFLYLSEVPRGAGPFTYAPRTHPLGDRRELPERDEQARSTDAQMAEIVPEREWVVCEGHPGTVVFADTCGYHKQLKPETDERLMLVAHYVSARPYVPRALELRGVDESALDDDQYVAVFDRLRG